jgi:hypothetical protein
MSWISTGLGAIGGAVVAPWLAGGAAGSALGGAALGGWLGGKGDGSDAQGAQGQMGPPPIPGYAEGGAPIGPLNIDQRGIEAFRQRALSQGQSPWAAAMLAKEASETQGQQEGLTRRGQSEIARGQDQLAMTGGLTGGAAERLQKAGTNDILGQTQELLRQSGLRRQDVGIEDERQRLQALSQLPGMEIAQVQPEFQRQQFNANLASQNAAARNAYNLQRYGIDSSIWGAAQLANATRDS